LQNYACIDLPIVWMKKPLRQIVIAIDGPAASGKSTTAREVARRLGLVYLDTGAMYRAVTFKAMREGIDLHDGDKTAEMTRRTQLELLLVKGEQRVILDGEDVSLAIRTPEVTAGTTPVSSHPQVREILVGWQRRMGAAGGVVAEGRDTTSVVFPNADVKIFLCAAIEARAGRRMKDLESLGVVTSPNEQSELLSRRDHADSSRKASPLIKVADAIEIDTSAITIEQQVQKVVDLAREVAES
jgi:cytidylate kinase